ncbi:PAS domain-containing sensor histidine kinase [Fodinibius sediminis]|nr:ATP-binding protein [Fodinibius sediminis]
MRRLIRQKDWSETSLGSKNHWPATLSSTVDLITENSFPIAICWGPELTTIYNDAYRPLLGNKTEALGQPFLEIWSEAQNIISPQINQALKGQSSYFKDAEFTLIRYGKPEKAWFDYTYSPLRDARGKIRGVINMVIEVTDKIRAQQKLQEMNETLENRIEQRTAVLEDYKNELRILSYQLNQTKEQERHHLAILLHNHVGQLLDLGLIQLDQLKKEVSQVDIPEKIANLKEIILTANKYTREFVNELKPPPIFEKENIGELLLWLARRMEKYGLKITLEDDGKPKPLTEEVHKILYHSTRELFFNVIKHAEVSEARLTLRRQDSQIQLIVEDMGKGFSMKGKKPTTHNGGFGLFNMQERLDLLGGRLEIKSELGTGTKAVLSAPLKNSTKTTPSIMPEILQQKTASPPRNYDQSTINDPSQLSLPLNWGL